MESNQLAKSVRSYPNQNRASQTNVWDTIMCTKPLVKNFEATYQASGIGNQEVR